MTKMNYVTKSIILWIFSIIFTIAIAVYQRMTGPTYPVSGDVELAGSRIDYEFLRSHGGAGDAPVVVPLPEESEIRGYFTYRRYKSHDQWDTIAMEKRNDTLFASVPHQPAAGKVQYNVILESGDKSKSLEPQAVIIRFKGAVPNYILIPHVLLMFLAMLFSTRTGLEVLIRGKRTYLYTIMTLAALIPGGLILGPVMQKFAFGAFWTGWPVSNDLTDNKTLIAFIFWIIAFIVQWRNRKQSKWALIASIILLVVYMIPHSVLGSEIDYREMEENKAQTEMQENRETNKATTNE